MKNIWKWLVSSKKLLNPAQVFMQSERGSAMPFIALGILMLTGATGTAIDMARVQIVQTRLQTALDAAGLAVGSEIHTANIPVETSKYFYANFPTNYLGTTITSLTATPNSGNTMITLAVTGTVHMSFMQLFGVSTVNVSASSQITLQTSGMELVLVLDNTGSMNSPVDAADSSVTKIAALKSASTELISILYGSNTTVPNLWISLVPFTQAVNIGTSYSGWMNTAYDNTLNFGPASNGTDPQTKNFGLTNWSGCVMARPSPFDISDDPPAVASFQAYWFAPVPTAGTNYNPWRTTSGANYVYNLSYSSSILANQGPNALCPQPITPMTGSQTTITNGINSMVAAGDTDLDLGLVWGWRLLSPRWQGLWGGTMNTNNLPLAYNTPLMNKVVIFMTDGENRFVPGDYSGYGFLADNQLGSTNETTAETTLDSRTLALCSSMKAQGIIIYTIGFGVAGTDRSNPDEVNTALLQSCATDANHYFLAPTNAQLNAAFQQIGDSLANLRISQ